jgi:hypothetical protein
VDCCRSAVVSSCKKLVAEAGVVRNTEEGKRPPLEATTEQRTPMCVCVCVLINCKMKSRDVSKSQINLIMNRGSVYSYSLVTGK